MNRDQASCRRTAGADNPGRHALSIAFGLTAAMSPMLNPLTSALVYHEFFNGPPVTVAESSLTEMPHSITLPPASMTVYEFEVR